MKKLKLKGVTKDGKSYRYRYEVKLALGMVSKRSRVLCKVTEPYAVIMEHYNRVLNEVDSETKFNLDDLYNLYKTKPGYEDREEESIKAEVTNAEVLSKHFGNMPIDEIKLQDVVLFVRRRCTPDNGLTKAKKTDSPSQAKKEKNLLSRIFDYGAQMGICGQIDTSRIAIPKVKPRTRVIETWEFNALRESMPEIVELFTRGSYLLCARQKDMRKLSEKQLEREGIFIKQSKTGQAQIKEFNPALKDWCEQVLKRYRRIKLKCIEKGKPVPTVLLCKEDGSMYSASGVKTQMSRAWKKLKVTHGVEDGVDLRNRITFHTYKRTSITYFKKDGRRATKEEKQEMSGHKTRSMLDIYDMEVPVVPSNVLPTEEKDKPLDMEDGQLRDTIVELEKHRIGRGGRI